MYGRNAKKLARELGLADSEGVGYGVIDGFGATVADTVNGRALHLYVGAPEGAWPDIEAALTKPKRKYAIRSIESNPKGGTVEIIFNATIGTNKRIKSFIENEFPALAELGFSGAARCAFCGERVKRSETTWALAKPDDVALPLHDACYYDYERQLGQQASARAAEPGGGILSVIGALLGGLIGSIPWVILYVVGFMASYAGILIGLGANYGHKLLGGKPGKGRLILVLLTIVIMVPVALAAGELASLAWAIIDGSFATSAGYASDAFILSDTLAIFRTLWEDPASRAEMIPIIAQNLAIGYLFAALGGIGVYFGFLRRENRTSRAKLVRLAKAR